MVKFRGKKGVMSECVFLSRKKVYLTTTAFEGPHTYGQAVNQGCEQNYNLQIKSKSMNEWYDNTNFNGYINLLFVPIW